MDGNLVFLLRGPTQGVEAKVAVARGLEELVAQEIRTAKNHYPGLFGTVIRVWKFTGDGHRNRPFGVTRTLLEGFRLQIRHAPPLVRRLEENGLGDVL